MKITEAKLKQIIAEETLTSLIENNHVKQAVDFYFENKDVIGEGFLDKFVPASMRGNRIWSDIERKLAADEQPSKIQDLEKQVQYLMTALSKIKAGDNKAKQDHVKDLRQAAPKADPAAIDAAAQALDVIDNNPTALKQAQAAIKAPADAKGEKKPDSVAKTTRDLKDIIANSGQRRMLLRGLLGLLTNDAVERVLKFLRPKEARKAVIDFLRQVLEMDTDIGAQVIANMSDEIANEFDADANEFRGEKGSEKFKGKVGSLVDGSVLKNENVNKELTEKVAILETLNLYFEKKSSK